MRAKRKGLSKRTRFEVFKRDGFRCVYCGATPLNATLQVDHVVAVANGGTNDPSNLVTSCGACNLGKGAIRLDVPTFKGATEQREHLSQLRAFLALQEELAGVKREALIRLAQHWESTVGPLSREMMTRLQRIMETWPYDKMTEAMAITGRKMGSVGSTFDPYTAEQQGRYFNGILRNWRAGVEF